MNQAKIRATAEHIMKQAYQAGVPQQFPRIVFWLGKSHGDTWQDEYQNALVDAFIQSPQMTIVGPDRYRCSISGQEWLYTEWEWRMNAVKKTMSPATAVEHTIIIGAPLTSESANVVGEWFATTGFEPTDKHQLTLPEWEKWVSARSA